MITNKTSQFSSRNFKLNLYHLYRALSVKNIYLLVNVAYNKCIQDPENKILSLREDV